MSRDTTRSGGAQSAQDSQLTSSNEPYNAQEPYLAFLCSDMTYLPGKYIVPRNFQRDEDVSNYIAEFVNNNANTVSVRPKR